ncbi:anti-sigma-factor antagonist [Glaciihabitans tibetensis]|uniref:Anti-sigma factor antagonist n=1 Tax=Glaciihabitans tibetensis TaxID=1266600 RepID=A0A2T0VDA3_9MICO|nr:STAS domain-containing protein [Glaciihabitans tibetensis]PRY68142.1 anti-sigma-factor antagonist [Glaciihabitans tibetensis]
MEFHTELLPEGIVAIAGEGRLNMVSAPELRAVVEKEIGAGHTRVVVDLSEIEFIDSSGLGALVGCLKGARQAGGDLRIAGPNKQVTMVLQLSNLDRVLKSYGTAGDAYRE